MADNNAKKENFYAGGFLYNPKTRSVLLHHRDDKTLIHPNQWGFFGGLNEGDELPKECFMRELKEELGIEVGENEVKALCDYLNKDRGTWRYAFYVQSELDKSQMTLGEGAGFDWIPLEQISKYDLTEKTKKDLETFVQKQKENEYQGD